MAAQTENSKLIITAQKIDSEISIVREWLLTGKFPSCIQDFAPASYELKAYWIGRKSLFLDTENILWRNRSATGSRAQLVVPMSLGDTIFNDSHHTTYGGHFGMTHTHSKIQLHYFWPGMSDFIRDRITACHKCIARKSPVNRHQPMGHEPVSGRFERLAMDLLDVSVISAKGYKYIRAKHRQKRNYDSKAVACAFPIGSWARRYYPPAGKNKLCSPWIGPYKIVRAPMEWVVGIQVDADAQIFYVHMDDLKRCATPDPEPSWPDTACGTSIVVSTHAPSTFAHTDIVRSQQPTASNTYDWSEDIVVKTDTVPAFTWDLHDAKCILLMNSDCCIDVKGFRFFTMERLFYALQLLTLGDKKYIRQLAKYTRMDYVRKCVNTRFELASTTLQDKWLDEQFQTWTQIITARILSDTAFKQALLDSAGSPLCDPDDPVYATALTSAKKMCVEQKQLSWPTWISIPTRVTRGQVRS